LLLVFGTDECRFFEEKQSTDLEETSDADSLPEAEGLFVLEKFLAIRFGFSWCDTFLYGLAFHGNTKNTYH
jgi:hypothetical protein